MFPIGDDNSDRTITPYVNYAIIGLNILVFVLLQGLGGNDAFTYAFSLVPREISTGIDLTSPTVIEDAFGHHGVIPQFATPLPVYFNFLSSMFMHGGIAHISATCCSFGYLATISKTCSGTLGISSSIFCADSQLRWRKY